MGRRGRVTSSRHLIGLISDTHGMLRPEVFDALAGVDRILHAGDVGPDDILIELEAIAPVQAVFGNTDMPGNPRHSAALTLDVGGVSIHVSHGHEVGSPTPAKLLATYPQRVLVYGHTHRQLISEIDGRLAINPGAAGARRFDLQPSVARLEIVNGVVTAELIPLG
jgi:uncharacterized protein